MEFNFEAFQSGRFARAMRWGLFGVCVYGVVGEWWVMNGYEAYDKSEAQEFIVDYEPISKPKAQLYVLPDLLYPNYSPWTPYNGNVVLGRIAPQHPNWVQLLGGRFVERSSCGIDLMIPKADYERIKLEREKATQMVAGAEALKEEMNRKKTIAGEQSFFSKFRKQQA